MPELDLIEGGNFRIDVERGVAICRVWRRPDVDFATGARFAEHKRNAFGELVERGVRGMVFDLSDAPLVAGPVSEKALGDMIALWERAKRPIGVVVGAAPLRRLQMERITTRSARHFGKIFEDPRHAEDWVREALARPNKAGHPPNGDKPLSPPKRT